MWESGFLAIMFLLAMRENTMKWLIGLFTWFGGCFLVWRGESA